MGGRNLILLLSIVCNIAVAQTEDLDCVTDDETSPDPAGKYSYATSSENQINNPDMINQLEPGLYKIEKQHEDGAVEQTIIIKDNQ